MASLRQRMLEDARTLPRTRLLRQAFSLASVSQKTPVSGGDLRQFVAS